MPPLRDTCLLLVRFAMLALVLAGTFPAGTPHAAEAVPPLPETLSETGLFAPGTLEIAADKLPYAPQYPLWSDGAAKRRWLYLPPGTRVDATDPDAWQFPPGTRLWKEFGYDRPAETRYMERLADGSWRFAAYVWDDDGRDARLAPAEGIARLPVREAPGGTYAIPSREDCLACHDTYAVPVNGVGALQLSPDRDPLAPHAGDDAAGVDLAYLSARGLIDNLPPALLAEPPRIAAPTPEARAALGYLHGNCGHCHNADGPLAALELDLRQPARPGPAATAAILDTLLGYPSEFRLEDIDTRVVPGAAAKSLLVARMRSRDPLVQMPPLGTSVSDREAVALVGRWIQNDLHKLDARQESPR
jgi:mono/diheme cytochrome c family protein